jgi:hypothetical protein
MTVEYVRTLRRDGVFPDGFLIQSWYDQPDRNLPETEAGTFTNTVRDAARLINEVFPRLTSEDTGYGDMLYDAKSKRFAAILYHGTNTEAALKQYKFRFESGPSP